MGNSSSKETEVASANQREHARPLPHIVSSIDLDVKQERDDEIHNKKKTKKKRKQKNMQNTCTDEATELIVDKPIASVQSVFYPRTGRIYANKLSPIEQPQINRTISETIHNTNMAQVDTAVSHEQIPLHTLQPISSETTLPRENGDIVEVKNKKRRKRKRKQEVYGRLNKEILYSSPSLKTSLTSQKGMTIEVKNKKRTNKKREPEGNGRSKKESEIDVSNLAPSLKTSLTSQKGMIIGVKNKKRTNTKCKPEGNGRSNMESEIDVSNLAPSLKTSLTSQKFMIIGDDGELLHCDGHIILCVSDRRLSRKVCEAGKVVDDELVHCNGYIIHCMNDQKRQNKVCEAARRGVRKEIVHKPEELSIINRLIADGKSYNDTRHIFNMCVRNGNSLCCRYLFKCNQWICSIPDKCATFTCGLKGFIPIGERHFPDSVFASDGTKVKTDVIEGSVNLTNLMVGDHIESTTMSGTLGGILLYYNRNCFITCAHVMLDEQSMISRKNNPIHNKDLRVFVKDTNGQKIEYGNALRCDFETGSDTKPGIDVAVIEMKSDCKVNPNSMVQDSAKNPHSHLYLGMSNEYLNDNYIDYELLTLTHSEVDTMAFGQLTTVEHCKTVFGPERMIEVELKNLGQAIASANSSSIFPIMIAQPAHFQLLQGPFPSTYNNIPNVQSIMFKCAASSRNNLKYRVLHNDLSDYIYFLVIKAHVVSSAVVPAKTGNYNVKEITVNVLEDFKNNVQGDRIVLTTAEYSTFCGVSFQMIHVTLCQIFIGTFEEGSPLRYRINTCGFQRRCSAMTDVQLSGLNGGYEEGCKNNCKVLSPYAAEEDIGCKVNYQTDNISCLQNYGVCDSCDHAQCNGRQCMWRITNTPNPGCTWHRQLVRKKITFFDSLSFLKGPGTEAVRIYFDSLFPNNTLDIDLRREESNIRRHAKRWRLTVKQLDLMFPAVGKVTSKVFDITLLIGLIRNFVRTIGHVVYPTNKDWESLPDPKRHNKRGRFGKD
ncbi:unnamed protein product [Mytilus edulis]|uniref:DZIP3-like HEPN domain-containing protein n=1 Tax=Mytilus edulis TaxID=6550 RepID=A0A8S3SMG7_MYTED|nr:unnamed protein product [Mytilus edulis]